MPVYQPNIPTGTVDLDQDYQNIQANFDQLNIAYGVDHVPFSDTSGVPPGGITGMHTILHLQSKATPAAIAAVGQLFNAVVNDGHDTNTILYFKTGITVGNPAGNLLQLTSNIQPVLGTNGVTFLPGGLILQWGKISSISSGLVTFNSAPNIAFTNCYSIWTQPFYTGTAPNGAATVSVKQNTNVSFNWVFNTNSSNYNGFYWIALGN